MPAVLGLGWWQTPMSWPPVEILFQQQLPTGTSVHVPTPALYPVPSVGLFWPPTKPPHAVAYSREPARAAGGTARGVDGTATPLPARERGNQRRCQAGLAPHRFRRALQ